MDHIDVLAVSSMSTDQWQQTPHRHMWSADVAALSIDGWQPNEDAVVMRSQRLVTTVPPDTVQQCRPGIGASSHTVCTWCAQARQANEGRHVVAASDHGRTSSRHWPLGLLHLTLVPRSLLLHKTTATYPINQLVQQPQNFDPISHQYTIITNP